MDPARGELDPCGRLVLLSFVKDPAGAIDASCVAARRVNWSLPGSVRAAEIGLRPEELAARLAAQCLAGVRRR